MNLLPKDDEVGYTPYVWLVYIVPFVAGPWLRKSVSSVEIAITFAALAAFLVLYFRGYWAKGRERTLIIGALVAMACALWPSNAGAGAIFIYAASFAGFIDPPRRSMRYIGAIALIVAAQAWWLEMNWYRALWPFVFVLIIGGINLHFSQVSKSNARLRLAHDEIEHLAKSAERERIARDLHDLLGHTLSVIILKSELASKLADRDPERARNEIRDVERISRDALGQVRNAVRGYRSGGLQREIDAARTALQSANVALQAQLAPITFTAAQEAVLALALRESVTNVIRHAYAKNCVITLAQTTTGCTLTIADDGSGGSYEFGTGLTGMRERIEALGGTLSANGTRGTTLTIEVPLDSVLSPKSSSLHQESA
jgi:two-component system sensor histidine kinase DesK